MKKLTILTTACLALYGSTMAQKMSPGAQVPQSKKIRITETMRYLLYTPESARKNQDGNIPLMVFLHGAGERGDDLDLVKKHGPPRKIAAGKEFPFFVLSPQCPEGSRWSSEKLYHLIRYIVDRYPVDEKRIYITGLSMGGYGTWDLLASHPGLFAAAVPICGGGAPWVARVIRDTPVWVFHGARDEVVPIAESEQMVEAIRTAGGHVRFTVYPEAGHDAWTVTYDNPALYDWMLEQSR